MKSIRTLSFLPLMLAACAHSPKTEPAKPTDTLPGSAAIRSMTGCYLVDYSYVETEGLKPGYKRDSRIYDVNKTKAVKEWIYAEDVGPKHIRLQHILFAADPQGKLIPGSELKHQAEDWEFEAASLYDFKGPQTWENRKLEGKGHWTRKITNLDDGLRYQCAAGWSQDTAYPHWSCQNYAPIPGRETRDMGRKDYNTLERSTQLIVYGDSWLERQENTKMIDEKNKRTPLAKESGKNWYVRLPDRECVAAQDFAKTRQPFWALLRETWDEVFQKGGTFKESTQKPPRFAKMMEIESSYSNQNLSDPKIREQARQDILKTIQEYRIEAAASAAPKAVR